MDVNRQDIRPELTTEITLSDFQDFYWLKSELEDFCREIGLPASGSKIALSQRIEYFISTGKKPVFKPDEKPTSNFDWASSSLTDATIITDNYKNSQNVRAFFTEHLGPGFKFNTEFMSWMKANVGKTLGDACEHWIKIKSRKKSKVHKDIAPQFEYNTYIRDFLKANPELSKQDAIHCWNQKRQLRGHNKYEQSDLNWL